MTIELSIVSERLQYDLNVKQPCSSTYSDTVKCEGALVTSDGIVKMSRRNLQQTGANTIPLGGAGAGSRGGGGGPSLLNPSYLGGGGGEFAGCDPGPLAGRDTPPPGGGVKELPTLKILVVDCKQGAVRAVR